MWATHKAKLGISIFIFPNDGVIFINSFKFGIINNIGFGIFFNKRLTKLCCFGCEVFNMVKANCTVRSGCRTKVFKICAGGIVKLCTEPFVKTYYIWYILHNLHTDCRT